MAKLKSPLFSFLASGPLGKALSFRRRNNKTIAELKPVVPDVQSLAQMSWRTMYLKAVALWHALSPAEKLAWESSARPHHMVGFAYFMSSCLKPNPGVYLPLLGGSMQGDIIMSSFKISGLPVPAADTEAATKKYVDDATPPTPSKIIDADGDTSFDVEQSADEDIIRGKVANVEAFNINASGILTLAKQSGFRAHRSPAQSIPSSTWTKILFNTEVFDVQNEYDHVTNHYFKAKSSGIYLACTAIGLSTINDGTKISIQLYLNNNLYSRLTDASLGSSTTFVASGLTLLPLSIDDYLDIRLTHNHGSAVNTLTGNHRCWFSVVKLS